MKEEETYLHTLVLEHVQVEFLGMYTLSLCCCDKQFWALGTLFNLKFAWLENGTNKNVFLIYQISFSICYHICCVPF